MTTRIKDSNIALSALVVGLCLGLIACPPPERELDWNSGGDETRDKARKLFAGQNVTDSLDDPNGDNTDWKLIRIREPGDLDLTVAIDDTRRMSGFVSVKDGFGVELGRRSINATDNLYTFSNLPVFQGEIFVQVFVERGRTTYTAGAAFRPSNRGIAVGPGPSVGDPDRRPKNGGSGGRNPKDPVTDPTSKPVTDPGTKAAIEGDPVDTGEKITLRGKIERFVELENGGSQLVIVGFGSDDGVAAGMSGQIVGLGSSFRITRVRRKGATAVSKATADQLGPYKSVVLKLKVKQ
jgi:hypothetical protein